MAAPTFGSTCAKVFAFVAGQRSAGATRDELSRALQLPIQSICPAVADLRRRGLLRQTTARRPTSSGRPAAVLIASRPEAEGQRDE
jgi:predicted ArsR family transcriptional regulator